jgi:nitroreductase/FMN reductase [NAD(P)H]
MRLPLDVTLHVDRYDDSLLGDAVDAYDRRRDARYSIPHEQQRRPEVFGYASLYGWSEDKARQATEAEGRDFPRYLRTRGFTMD